MVDRSVFVELFRHDLFLSSLLAPLFVERRSSFAISAGERPCSFDLGVDRSVVNRCAKCPSQPSQDISGRPDPQEDKPWTRFDPG
jgi:hypothetical protein